MNCKSQIIEIKRRSLPKKISNNEIIRFYEKTCEFNVSSKNQR